MFDSIKIIATDCGPKSIKFFTVDGQEIKGVCSCDITMRPNSIVTATLDIYPEGLDIKAHPLLTEDTLKWLADYYGYNLVLKLSKKEDNDGTTKD